MEYQVPQFIEVENHIVGPLSLKQFLYVAGGGGICVAALVYLPLLLAVPIAVLVGSFSLALAFYRVNGKPLISLVEAGFNYYTHSKLFLWRHEDTPIAAQPAKPEPQTASKAEPRLNRGKLSELAWSLDVSTGAPQDDDV